MDKDTKWVMRFRKPKKNRKQWTKDTKWVMRIRKSKKNRKHNGQRGNENRKSKKNRTHNGQKIPKG